MARIEDTYCCGKKMKKGGKSQNGNLLFWWCATCHKVSFADLLIYYKIYKPRVFEAIVKFYKLKNRKKSL